MISLLFSLLVHSSVGFTQTDIQEGDCLGFEDVYHRLGAYSLDLYLSNHQCGEMEAVQGEYDRCQLEDEMMETGEWSRSFIDHPKPGFWWPKPVPCMTSVRSAQSEVRRLKSTQEVCAEESSYMAEYIYEHLDTERTKILQGELYLPNPLILNKVHYAYDEILGHREETCSQIEIRARYDGLFSMSVELKENRGCPHQEKQESCKVFTIGQGENSQGQSCGLIKKIRPCP